jgi:hypothetical protein
MGRQSTTILLILFVLVVGAWAQTETGQISGTILDPTGAIVPAATIDLKGLDTGLTRRTTSTSAGTYVFASLLPGRYQVSVSAAGFSRSTQPVEIAVGGRMGLDFHLQVGKAETVIEVTETAGQINTESQTLASVVSQKQVVELPTLTRNPYDLIATAGNVTENGAYGRGGGFVVNGQRAASNNILLDGAANNDEFTASVGMAVPLDSVQEFSIMTNNFTAEYGRAAGGVVNVATKAGTNDFHGSLYEYNRVSRLSSNTPENNANGIRRSVFDRNQFGYAIGGPIKRDKLFFFQNTEWIRVRSASTQIVWVPTPQLIAAAAPATQSFFSQLGKLRSGLVPLNTLTKADMVARKVDPCAGAAAGGPCQLLTDSTPMFTRVAYNTPSDAGGGVPRNEYQLVGRIDYNINDRTQIYGRYALQNQFNFDGTNANSPYTGYDTGSTNRDQSYLVSLVKTLSPSLVSQSKAVFNRFNNFQPLGSAPVTPTLYFNPNTAQALLGNNIALPGYLPYTPGNGIPFGGPQNFVQLYQDMNWNHGRHQVRFGGSYNYLRDNRSFGAYQEPVAALNTNTRFGPAIDNLLRGTVSRFQGAVYPQGKFPCDSLSAPTPACTLNLPVGPPDFTRSNRYQEFAAYAQDGFKITPRFTLNAGLRWEYFGVQHNKNDQLDSNFYDGSGSTEQARIRSGDVFIAPNSPIGSLWNKTYGNFAPRVGFAWDLTGDGKTSLRGGYGISYERNFGNVTFNMIQNPPNYAVVSLTAGVDVPTIGITTSPSGPLAGSSGTKALPAVSLRNVDSNIKQAYAQMWDVSLERQLTKNVLAAVDYSASKGTNLYGIANYNMIGAGNVFLGDPCTKGDPTSCVARLKTTRYSNINRRDSQGSSDYNAMNFRMNFRNVANSGVNLLANWTWAHAIDTLSSTFSESSNNGTNLGYLDPFNPGLDRGNAEFDTRHRLAISAVWELPLARHAKGAVKDIAGGWELDPIVTMRTGAPFSLFDSTNTAYWATMRAAFNGNVPSSGNSNGPAEGTPNRIIYYQFPANLIDSSYVNPISGTSEFGPWPKNMTGRDAFRGPGSWDVTMAVHKNIAFNERVKAQFRGEFYNMLNHPNLVALTGESDVASYNYMTAKRDGRRNVQLALRISF